MQLTTSGIVLAHYKTEQDRILTILTRDNGVVTAYANGANRLRSSLASSTELLCYSRFVLFHNRDKYIVDKADSENIFFGIRRDLTKLALGCYLAQLAENLSPTGSNAQPFLSLLLNTLHYLEKGTRSQLLLKAIFELRLLTLAGYMPNLVACNSCGVFLEKPMLFSMKNAQLTCTDCYDNSPANGDDILLSAGVVAAMRHISYAKVDKLFLFSLSEDGLHELSQVCEQYTKQHLEKKLPTLDFYKGLGCYYDSF